MNKLPAEHIPMNEDIPIDENRPADEDRPTDEGRLTDEDVPIYEDPPTDEASSAGEDILNHDDLLTDEDLKGSVSVTTVFSENMASDTDESISIPPSHPAVANCPTTQFQLALGLWAEEVQLSRVAYIKLREVLCLLQMAEVSQLPRKLDTLKRQTSKQLPLLSIKHREIPVNQDIQPSSRNVKKEQKSVTQQYWYDIRHLFQDILSSSLATKRMYFGMAEYADSPVELWHSRAWGSSIRAVSGEFAYSQQHEILFPGDFVQFDAVRIADFLTPIEFGRIIFVGRDKRSKSDTYNQVVLTLQVVVYPDMLSEYLSESSQTESHLILVEDCLFEIEAQAIRHRIDLVIDYGQERKHDPAILITKVINLEQKKLRSTQKLHPLRAELEIEQYGRPYLMSLINHHKPTLAMPLLLFIDDFGIHRNMYRAFKAFYMTPANLSYIERRKVSNIFTLTLGPHGASMNDIVESFQSEFQDFERGTWMKINDEDRLVNIFIMALTGDMPQQAANGGFLSHRGTVGCRTCYCPKEQRANLQFDTITNGRYHYATLQERREGEAIASKTRQLKFWSQHGLQPDRSPLEALAPALDLILGRTYDAPHSEWKGLGRRMQELLMEEILTTAGVKSYIKAFCKFDPPVGWPQIQSPLHLKSWSLSEAGRAIILTPLILRCHAQESWFKPSYLRSMATVLRSLQSPDINLSPMSRIIQAYSLFASAVSAVSTASAYTSSLHQIILQGRQAFQQLIIATRRTPAIGTTMPNAQLVCAEVSETAASRFLKLLGLPNVHVGLHLAEFAQEYGTVMNCNVLGGELKHKTFKRWADQASPPNLMAYLFKKDCIRQSLRLGLAGAWGSSHPILMQQLQNLYDTCPALVNGLIHSDEEPALVKTTATSSCASQHKFTMSTYTHLAPTVFGPSGGFLEALQSMRRLPSPSYQQGTLKHLFFMALETSYCRDFSVHTGHRLHDEIFCFKAVKFHDRQQNHFIFRVNEFMEYGGNIVRVLQIITHSFLDDDYIFVLIEKLSLLIDDKSLNPLTDTVLNLPLYQSVGEWDLVGLHQIMSRPLFLTELPKEQGQPQKFLRCDWSIDYL